MLEYDNSAFYYFALTLLSFYLIPATWYTLSEVYAAFIGKPEAGTEARTGVEKEKASKLKKSRTGVTRLKRLPFLINIGVLSVALLVFGYLVAMVKNDGEVNRFDPYRILELEHGAQPGEIKKSYRKLSLKYHPDKNIGDKTAEEMFMKIAKAYEALTDETSKENYEKYGNPDGKQALEVSIGLPKIILENPKVVLVLYLLALVVVIPVAVGLWYAYSKQFGEKNIMYDTYSIFYQLLQEGNKAKNLPEVMAASAECQKINSTKGAAPDSNQQLVLGRIYGKMKNDRLMIKPRFDENNNGVILKGNLLLHSHVYRLRSELTPELSNDLDAMLSCGPDLIEGLVEMAMHRRWTSVTIEAIKFSQYLVQALWVNDSPFLQLPHFTPAIIKQVAVSLGAGSLAVTSSKDKGGQAQGPSPASLKLFADYLKLPESEKKGLDGLNEEQKKDVFSACKVIPNLKIDVKLFVEEEEKEDFFADDEDAQETDSKGTDEKEKGESTVAVSNSSSKSNKKGYKYNPKLSKTNEVIKGDDVYENDLVTIRVKLTRENVDVGKKAPPVHSPHFPKPITESWWIILVNEPKADKKNPNPEPVIHAIERLTDQSREVTHEIRFMAPDHVGDVSMLLHIISDCYLGVDETKEIRFSVKPAAELPDYEPHPEDVELDNEPTLFEQVMAANQDEDSSDDDEDEAAPERGDLDEDDDEE